LIIRHRTKAFAVIGYAYQDIARGVPIVSHRANISKQLSIRFNFAWVARLKRAAFDLEIDCRLFAASD
jgi:hypothetical protein